MHFSKAAGLLFYLMVVFSSQSFAQSEAELSFFEPADTFNKTRYWSCAAIGAGVYTGVMIGLNEIWYSEHERSGFHFFNDWNEWNNMDKMGHLYTAYFESNWVFQGARWTGLERRKAMWMGVAMGSLFQASIETLDGFSAKWGFSVPDIAFNTLGVGLFASQELLWQEQRIIMKVSSYHAPYPNTLVYSVEGSHSTMLSERAASLYGSSYPETFLKDYNAQTIWASVNPRSFINNPNAKFPAWLNIAVGYGSENMYGGFANEWEEDGVMYVLDDNEYPRYKQIYLSLDIDLTRIKTKSPFLKTLFTLANVIKIPAPTLEFNTLGKVKFHPIHF